MKLLIDSDVVSALSSPEFPEYQLIQQFFNQYHTAKIHLSILTVFEVEFNIASFKSDKHRQQQRDNLNVFKNAFGHVDLCFDSATQYGQLKHTFRTRTGTSKSALKRHNIDIALASVAIANDMTLVSEDKIYQEHLQPLDSRLKHLYWKL